MTTIKTLFAYLLTVASFAPLAGASPGGPLPDYGFHWATIGSPGNAPISVPVGHPLFAPPVRPIGNVDYTYRIATTEVTQGQWLEFVNAYAPYVDPLVANSSSFTSSGIVRIGGSYAILQPGAEIYPARVAWRFAARYANWLTNGKRPRGVATAADFEQGAYDTSTCGRIGAHGDFTDQDHRSPGATFFLPTYNEWVKAVFFDPNRYGAGQPGYWQYPNTSATALTPGPPWLGGQTMNGWSGPPFNPPLTMPPPGVGGYPGVLTPWGLLDASGSAPEWTEDWVTDELGNVYRNGRWRAGSGSGDEIYMDQLGWVVAREPEGAAIGIRIASVVPAPSVFALGACLIRIVLVRRRNS